MSEEVEVRDLGNVVSVAFDREHFEKLEAMAAEQQCTVADIVRDEVTTMLAFMDWTKEHQGDYAAVLMEPDEPGPA